jgi:hypothetical protein
MALAVAVYGVVALLLGSEEIAPLRAALRRRPR